MPILPLTKLGKGSTVENRPIQPAIYWGTRQRKNGRVSIRKGGGPWTACDDRGEGCVSSSGVGDTLTFPSKCILSVLNTVYILKINMRESFVLM